MVKDLQTGEVLIEGNSNDSLYKFPVQINHTIEVNQSTITWHYRLGHLYIRALPSLARKNVIRFSDIRNDDLHCDSCHVSKIHKNPHISRKKVYSDPL